MGDIVLIKTDKYYYYHQNKKLYSLNLRTKNMLREATDYSVKLWNDYVNRMTTNFNAVVITEDNIISEFENKAKEIDANPRNIIQWSI
jgi:hypothetical protein